MRRTYVDPFDYRGPLGQPSRCHLQVHEGTPDAVPVAIVTELDDNPGPSITNVAAQVATTVWRRLLPHAREGVRRIEHDPARADAPGRYRRPESFDAVTFRLVSAYDLAQPRRTPTTREAVEELIGAPLARAGEG